MLSGCFLLAIIAWNKQLASEASSFLLFHAKLHYLYFEKKHYVFQNVTLTPLLLLPKLHLMLFCYRHFPVFLYIYLDCYFKKKCVFGEKKTEYFAWVCKICEFLSYFQQLRAPTLMLQLFGGLLACCHLKFKLPLITTTAASWTGEKGKLERDPKNIFKVFAALP